MKSARWTNAEHGNIEAVREDGTVVNIPVNELNMDYVALIESGLTIEEYVQPPTPLRDLTPRQIRLALLYAGITETMIDAQLTDPASIIEWKYASAYRRDHPLIAGLASIFALDDAMIDTLWLTAQQL